MIARSREGSAVAYGDWLIGELVALAGPAYFFLQLLMAARYRGGWRLAALAPLMVMVPLAVHAGLAYAAGAPAWPLLLILAAPFAFAYLLLVGVAKSSVGRSRRGGANAGVRKNGCAVAALSNPIAIALRGPISPLANRHFHRAEGHSTGDDRLQVWRRRRAAELRRTG